MGLNVFHWGWGSHTLPELSLSEAKSISDLVRSYKVNGVIGIRFNPAINLVIVMLDNRSGHQTEKSVLLNLSHDFNELGVARSVCVAVSGHAGVPHAFWAFNPATKAWEYLVEDPSVIDGSGRNIFAPNERAINPDARKPKGYKPYHEPGGLSPRCALV